MKIYNVVLLLFILANFNSFAQEEEYDTIVIRDIESWHNIQFEYKFNKKFKVGISEQIRLDENSLKLDRFFTELELEYNFWKGFDLGAGYRFITEQKKSGLSNGQRWNLDLAYSNKVNRFKFNTRIRYQSKIEFPKTENDKENYLRLKLKIDYNIKDWKFDPYFTSEIFRTTNHTFKNSWDNYRFTLGTNYDFNKHHALSLFYGGEKELNVANPKTTFLFGLGYKYTLKHKKNDQ